MIGTFDQVLDSARKQTWPVLQWLEANHGAIKTLADEYRGSLEVSVDEDRLSEHVVSVYLNAVFLNENDKKDVYARLAILAEHGMYSMPTFVRDDVGGMYNLVGCQYWKR